MHSTQTPARSTCRYAGLARGTTSNQRATELPDTESCSLVAPVLICQLNVNLASSLKVGVAAKRQIALARFLRLCLTSELTALAELAVLGRILKWDL